MKIYVGLWSIDASRKTKLGPDATFEILKNTIEYFSCKCELNKYKEEKFNAIFIAPEYLFHAEFKEGVTKGKSNSINSYDYLLSENDKNLILIKLLKLSEIFNSILIIPGSIAWEKKIDAPKKYTQLAAEIISKNNNISIKSKDQKGYITDSKESHILRLECSLDKLEKSRVFCKKNLNDVVSAPLGIDTPAKTTEQKVIALKSAEYISKNTAYVLLNGKKIFVYNKRSDFHEVWKENKTVVFIPGSKEGEFEIFGVKFRIQICLDHFFAVKSNIAVDMQIMISTFLTPKINDMNITPYGYYFHCSGQKCDTEIVQIGNAKIKPLLTENINEGTLFIYEINLDLK